MTRFDEAGWGGSDSYTLTAKETEETEELRDGIMQKSRGRMPLPRQVVNESP